MNGVSFPRLQRIDYRFKWVKEGVAAKLVSRGLLALLTSSGKGGDVSTDTY